MSNSGKMRVYMVILTGWAEDLLVIFYIWVLDEVVVIREMDVASHFVDVPVKAIAQIIDGAHSLTLLNRVDAGLILTSQHLARQRYIVLIVTH